MHFWKWGVADPNCIGKGKGTDHVVMTGYGCISACLGMVLPAKSHHLMEQLDSVLLMYRWWHNQVLKEFRDVLKEVVADANEKEEVTSGQVIEIHFHVEGEYSCGDLEVN